MRRILFFALLAAPLTQAAEPTSQPNSSWRIGTPIVTYWCGPALTDEAAAQMAQGGFNVVWCSEKALDVAQRHGLRAQLTDGLLSPSSLDDPAQREKLDSLIARVRLHPALYAYHLTDEPSVAHFPALGRLVAHLRERDPAHLAYINLFPTYASNEQLGTTGDVVTAYREHLHQYTTVVKPALISYDHYQFQKTRDSDQYFLNLALIRRSAQAADVPFLNIVQASSWEPGVRVPTTNELRYLVFTSLAYGAQGISYYIYTCANHAGGIANADGSPTPIYHALKSEKPPANWQKNALLKHCRRIVFENGVATVAKRRHPRAASSGVSRAARPDAVTAVTSPPASNRNIIDAVCASIQMHPTAINATGAKHSASVFANVPTMPRATATAVNITNPRIDSPNPSHCEPYPPGPTK